MLAEKYRAAQAQPDPPPPDPATLSVREAARALGCTQKQIRLALQEGTLRGFKPGGLPLSRWRVLRASVDALTAPGAGEADALADLFRRHARLSTEQAALAQRIEDALRAASPCRDGGVR